MKCGGQIAIAVVGGYLLGRSHKTRLAALLALLAAGGKLPIDQKELLSKTPLGAPLDKLTGDLRSQLVDAGVSVVKKAATSRMDSFSDKLQQRAESMRAPGAARGAEPEDTVEREEPARPPRERREPPRRERARERDEPERRERAREEPVRRERARVPESDEDDYVGDDYDDDDRDEYEDEDYERDDDDRDEPEPDRDYREERRPAARSARSEPPRRAPRREREREDDRPRRGRATR
jgi:hypothetical protein